MIPSIGKNNIVTWTLVKDSARCSLAIFGALETIMAICGYSFADMLPDNVGWPERTLCFLLIFALICAIIVIYSCRTSRDGVDVEVNGKSAAVVVGDLFAEDGLKVIPFDERFDLDVDDKIISHTSLNGIFIEHFTKGVSLKSVIESQQRTKLDSPKEVDGVLVYPLGTVKPYGEYALLAFTHIDEFDRAHLTKAQYEGCLMSMWTELSTIYAGRKVVLPLLGSGITRFDDGRPSDDELLRCMLCTLRASGMSFKAGIEIVLTEETARDMRLYEIRDYAKFWK